MWTEEVVGYNKKNNIMCFYTLLITVDDKDKATGAKV